MLRHFLIDPLIPESAPWRCEQGAFCTCHANCLNALGAGILEACLGRGVYMPSIKTFLDDTTIILSRKQIVQRVLNKLNDLIHWCCMVLKPEKSRSLIRDKICRNMRWIFDELLCDKNQKAPIAGKILDTLNAIAKTPLQGWFKVWLLQFVLLLFWPLAIYEIGLPSMKEMERKINQWIGSGRSFHYQYHRLLSTVESDCFRLPLRSIVEELKISKIRTQWWLNNSKDRIRKIMPQLRLNRKFRAQEEIEKSELLRK